MNNVGVRVYVTDLYVNEKGELTLNDKSYKQINVGKIQTKVSEEINKNSNSIERE